MPLPITVDVWYSIFDSAALQRYTVGQVVAMLKSISVGKVLGKIPEMKKGDVEKRIWKGGYFVIPFGDKVTAAISR